MINSFPPTYDLLKRVMISQLNLAKKEFEDWKERSVTWSIDDFSERARQLEGDNWKESYDEELFEENLIGMIHQHQADIGINWDTIDIYLEYCKK